MKSFTKKLGKGEIKWGGIVIPHDKASLFPLPGVEFDLFDGQIMYPARMDRQSRLRIPKWFRQHRDITHGDEVTFSLQCGKMHISDSRSFSVLGKELMDLVQQIIDAVHNSEVRKCS